MHMAVLRVLGRASVLMLGGVAFATASAGCFRHGVDPEDCDQVTVGMTRAAVEAFLGIDSPTCVAQTCTYPDACSNGRGGSACEVTYGVGSVVKSVRSFTCGE